MFGIYKGTWSSIGSCYFINLKFFFRNVWRRVVSVCGFNVKILYLVDDIFIYLELMKFSIDLAETRCMSFMVTFVTGNVFRVKFWFGFWLKRFVGLGKFIGLFVIRFIWFGIKLLTVFMGWSFIRRFFARIFFRLWTGSAAGGCFGGKVKLMTEIIKFFPVTFHFPL